jgi:hypothetical protein
MFNIAHLLCFFKGGPDDAGPLSSSSPSRD